MLIQNCIPQRFSQIESKTRSPVRQFLLVSHFMSQNRIRLTYFRRIIPRYHPPRRPTLGLVIYLYCTISSLAVSNPLPSGGPQHLVPSSPTSNHRDFVSPYRALTLLGKVFQDRISFTLYDLIFHRIRLIKMSNLPTSVQCSNRQQSLWERRTACAHNTTLSGWQKRRSSRVARICIQRN